MKNGEQAEAWKDIIGYEGLYLVSNYGRIKSLRTMRLMRTSVNKRNGYIYIGLTKERIQKGHRVHRLVAKAFIENAELMPEVNHEDFDKTNNCASNLKWCDRYYQNQHAAKKPGRRWQRHRLGKSGNKNPKSKPVVVTSTSGEVIGNYESQHLAAIATNSEPSKISLCCLGKRKSHNHLKFKYA